ncbi:MAG: histidine kinase dimerization/phosphoacceptor domain -containing protein [Leptospira sp.]|nr:histidine kinase dimerization/phosphoacceptor domain -containing protein [Leptospira sp.]
MKAALRVSLLYLLLGVLWIYFSDYALSIFNHDSERIRMAQSYKGWFYVAISSILIFLLLKRELDSQYRTLKEKKKADFLYQSILQEIQDSVIVFNTSTWKVEMISHQTAKFFEHSRESIIREPNRLVERLHPEDHERMLNIWTNRLTENIAGILYRLKFPDGRIKWGLENRLYFFDYEENEGRAIAVTTDITDYIEKQKLLEISLKENETLLTEVHHRIKNNLAVIVSFLQLQTYSAPKESAIILEQSIARIKAIALVHEKLYSSKNLSRLNANDYIESLVENIKLMYMRMDIRIVQIVDSKDLNLTLAIPLGLMLTEMLTNSLRHAFIDKHNAEIVIKLSIADDEKMDFQYSDNGIGFPKGFDIQSAESIGLSVIFSLCSQMVGRIIEIKSEENQGILYHFEFQPKSKKQVL